MRGRLFIIRSYMSATVPMANRLRGCPQRGCRTCNATTVGFHGQEPAAAHLKYRAVSNRLPCSRNPVQGLAIAELLAVSSALGRGRRERNPAC